MLRGVVAFAFVAAAVGCPPASAANLTTAVSKENKTIVILNGEVAEGDAGRLKDIIKSSINSGRLVSGMRFNSSGGSLLESVRLAGLIQNAKIATVVANGATCASACFVAFAAGSQKFVGVTASVGIPGVSDGTGQDAGDATNSIARVVKELGVPEAIIEKMLAARSEIVWLTPDDLRTMGTTTTGKAGQPALSRPVAAQPPTQLAPSTRAVAPQSSALKNWNDVVSAALSTSREQNGGQPYTGKQCGLKFNSCATAVFYTGTDGRQVMVRTIKDLNGKYLVHETCTFNELKDERTCVDWDQGSTHRDTRDGKGVWRQVTDQ